MIIISPDPAGIVLKVFSALLINLIHFFPGIVIGLKLVFRFYAGKSEVLRCVDEQPQCVWISLHHIVGAAADDHKGFRLSELPDQSALMEIHLIGGVQPVHQVLHLGFEAAPAFWKQAGELLLNLGYILRILFHVRRQQLNDVAIIELETVMLCQFFTDLASATATLSADGDNHLLIH